MITKNTNDLRANPFRVAVTQDGVRVRYHPEMGLEFEHDGDWHMMCGAYTESLEWPAQWEEQK